jgi:3-oxoacyl-[acyl-carrier-protein] synthase-3
VQPAISLLGVASYLPERLVGNDFFAAGAGARRGMFTAPTTRHHVAARESAAEMIERASQRLIEKLNLQPARDIDIVLTNVAIPDQPFTGCGAEVAHRIGSGARWVVDLHNSGCVSFIYMLELVRVLLQATDARGALLCNVQNAAGRVFSHPQVRLTAQAPVPGDGCGVGYVTRSNQAPLLGLVQQCHSEFASDMLVTAADDRRYWEPGDSPISIAFTEQRVASIISRGNRLVPDAVRSVCEQTSVRVRDLALLITNQPNPIFLRNWREALELPPERHHATFDRNGNLFGAALPINLEDALAHGKLARGGMLALAGFSHAGDYSAAAVIDWGNTREAKP